MTPADDGAGFADAIKGRIRAMAIAHNLLSDSRWRGANLLTLVTEELAPYSDGGRVAIKGEAVSIASSVAQNLALALHELATNAAKYGALSHPNGRLSVTWEIDTEGLTMNWVEESGAKVSAPSRFGFGSKVVEASIKGQLRGSIEREWRAKGLCCRISFPSEHFLAPERSTSERGDAHAPTADSKVIRGRRILVLEDEPLIAMMTIQLVKDLDGSVIGPFASVSEAKTALASPLDAALLDVNVGGELVYDLAADLRRRGAPIVFVTGYQAAAIDPRFADAQVLTKPVEREELGAAVGNRGIQPVNVPFP
jgi:two-component sensor histidine kinase